MAVSVQQLKELRELGAKRVEFTHDGEVEACEFFEAASAAPPDLTPTEPAPKLDKDAEIPPEYAAAFSVLGRKPVKKEALG